MSMKSCLAAIHACCQSAVASVPGTIHTEGHAGGGAGIPCVGAIRSELRLRGGAGLGVPRRRRCHLLEPDHGCC
eukprot:1189605-Prorocentrum_minimum.AAC.3